MANEKQTSPNDEILYAGADAGTLDGLELDRGDLPLDGGAVPVVETPAPVVETPAPVVETPAPAPAPVVETPAPVVETPAPAPVATTPVEERPRDKRDFIERLNTKNRIIDDLKSQLAAATTGTPAPVAQPTAAPAAPAAPAVPAPAATDYTAKYQEAMQLQLDGKFEAAAKLQAEIATSQLAEATARVKAEALEEARREVATQRNQESLEQVYGDLVADYPFLDADDPTYDNVAVAAINAVAQDMASRGTPAASALRQATDQVLARFGLGKAAAALVVTHINPSVMAAPAVKPAAVAAAVAAAAAQPAAPAAPVAAPGPTGGIDIFSMSETEFDALTEKQLAIARGDILA